MTISGIMSQDKTKSVPIELIIVDAAAAFLERFGIEPTVCEINISYQGQVVEPAGMRIQYTLMVWPHCALVGVETAQEPTLGKEI